MITLRSLISGAIGAGALTLLHETARRRIPDAPRVDVLGSRALDKGIRLIGQKPPDEDRLHTMALGGDLVSNSVYYSLVGKGDDGVWLRGILLGLVAGLGAVFLPGPLGLGSQPSNRTRATQVMTVAWYLVGGLAAASAARVIEVVAPD